MSLKYQVVITRFRMRYLRYGQVHRYHGNAVIWNDGDMFRCEYGFGVMNDRKYNY